MIFGRRRFLWDETARRLIDFDQVSDRSAGHVRSTVWRFSGSVVKRIAISTMLINETLFVFANAFRLCSVAGCRSKVPNAVPLDKWIFIRPLLRSRTFACKTYFGSSMGCDALPTCDFSVTAFR